jgi:precorrin-4 C11-methyltransferase
VPKVLTVGIGLAHQAGPAESIWQEIETAIEQSGYLPQAVRHFCTIDVKADEPVVKLLQERGATVRFFSAEELASIDVPTPSDIVAQHVGTPSVCEAAAILGSDHGELVVPKQKGKNWTLAIAAAGSVDITPADFRRAAPLPCQGTAAAPLQTLPLRGGAGGGVCNFPPHRLESQTPPPSPPLEGRGERTREADTLADERGERTRGFVEIVGAGPGDPDLISVRGRRMLERADLILYAGSLVPKALTDCHKPGAVVRSSADMTLEEQCALMKEHYMKGHFIVRLHTGDPCIFGAIQEQMAFFDREGIDYHITPGISSFLAAAAELRSQFTIPERTQTIILTRGEGRTPMPEKEQLHLLARSQSTMCIFLSAAIVDDVQAQLLQHYPEDTPVAACYRLTWPDQKIYRGVLKDLARIVHDNGLTLTTMLVVGEAIDNRAGLSALYDKHFTHLFRQGEN